MCNAYWHACCPPGGSGAGSPHLGVAQQGLDAVHGAVQHGKEQDGDAGEQHVEGGRADVVHHRLPAEAVVELRARAHTLFVIHSDQAKDTLLVDGNEFPARSWLFMSKSHGHKQTRWQLATMWAPCSGGLPGSRRAGSQRRHSCRRST